VKKRAGGYSRNALVLAIMSGDGPWGGSWVVLRPVNRLSNMTERASGEGQESGDSFPLEKADSTGPRPGGDRVWILGIPFVRLRMAGTVQAICDLIDRRDPAYIITANLHYAMLTEQHVDLRAINEAAALIIADGAPLVWASRWNGEPLPERVAGSDLIFELSSVAAQRGFRLFLLGGAEGVAVEAAHRLCARYPGLRVVGTECPSLQHLSGEEEAALVARIRAARPDILLVAFGQPKGERWIYRHRDELLVPVSIQVGASLDFAAGMIRRAPRWMQKAGLEWAFRVALEPRRLFWRYAGDAWFLVRVFVRRLRRRVA
jgi:N-acetylglucosaminyldiphosphoundecaprenol N-acetyl-beta-D-mannosaminyltransferase